MDEEPTLAEIVWTCALETLNSYPYIDGVPGDFEYLADDIRNLFIERMETPNGRLTAGSEFQPDDSTGNDSVSTGDRKNTGTEE